MPWTRRRVVCGLSDTIAPSPPQSALTSVDLPTFGRPATAMKPLLTTRRPDRAAARGRRRPPPNKGWGCRPATHTIDGTDPPCARLRQFRAELSRVELPCVGQELGRRVRHGLAGAVLERHAIEPELPQPLPAATARRRCDPYRLEVAGAAAFDDGARERRFLGTDPERVRRVLDVHPPEHSPVSRKHHRTDEVVRVRRVG